MLEFIIYQVRHLDKILYIGSTRIKLNIRKSIHYYYYRNNGNCQFYNYIRKNCDFSELIFEEIFRKKIRNVEKYKINEIEQIYIDRIKPICNQRKAYCDLLRNGFSNNEYQKKYRSYNVVCDCGSNFKKSSEFAHKKCKKHKRYLECVKIN